MVLDPTYPELSVARATLVFEKLEKRGQTDGQTDRQTDGQDLPIKSPRLD